MPLCSHLDFIAALPASGSLLGIDLGTKTIGLALSDDRRTVASSHSVIKRIQFTQDAARLSEILNAHACIGVVLGWPLNMDGSMGPRAQSVKAFARNLSSLHDLPITLWDERLSTRAVERLLIDNDTTRTRRAALKDKLAATWILQGFLDFIPSQRETHFS